jgi:ribosomal protein S27AE
MKVKRICQNCGSAWYPAGLGIQFLRGIWNAIFVIGTKGSAVDVAALKNRDEKKDTTCPRCNYTVYREVYEDTQNTNNQGNTKRWIDK